MFQAKGMKNRLSHFLSRRLKAFKPADPGIIDPVKFLKNSKSILICAPFAYEEFMAALPALNDIIGKFTDCRLSLIVLHNFRNWLNPPERGKIITIVPEDANFFKFPRKSLRRYIQRESYDLAIDLNLGGILFSSILCSVCGANLRVGFANQRSEYFFNFQVLPRPDSDVQDKYRALLKYL
jgi:ADP-heptose:LPS heptosyltransferase